MIGGIINYEKKFSLGILLILLGFSLWPARATAPTNLELPRILIENQTTLRGNAPVVDLKGILASLMAGVDPEAVRDKYPVIYKVIYCESRWDNTARGKAGEIGIAQFMPTTWEWFNKMRDTNLDIDKEADQLEMIVWGFGNGYQRHWVCFRNLNK